MPRRRRARLTLSALTTGVAFVGSVAKAQDSPPLPATSVAAVATPPGPAVPVMAPHVHKTRLGRYRCLQCNGKQPLVLPPLGGYFYDVNKIQVANNAATRMILRNYDFVEGATELNHYGQVRLAQIVGQAGRTAWPILVEWTPDTPGLDQARRASVVELLANNSAAIAAERVLVGPDPVRGFNGAEAEIVDFVRMGRMTNTNPIVGNSSAPTRAIATSGTGFGR